VKEDTTESKFKQPSGLWGIVVKVLLVLIPICGILYIFNVPFYLGVSLFKQQYVAVFITLTLCASFLTIQANPKAPRDKLPLYDIVFALASLAVGGYIAIFYPQLLVYMGRITPTNIILGAISIILVLEAGRRLLGWPLVILGTLFIIYPFFSHLTPGILHTRQFPWERVLIFLYLNSSSLVGLPSIVASIIVLSFILFGRFLFMVGGGEFLTDLAMSSVGKYRGGPAKVAIVASAFFATLSGSASANVVTTGVISIPLMKRTGYAPQFAGAVEAAASTAGTITPPVMAAAAFLIAEFLEISYAKVAIAAAVPALLYYVALYTQVDLEAAKNHLSGLTRQELPSLVGTIRRGWLLIIPIGVLIYCLFILFLTPALSGLYATAAVFLVSWFRKETRVGLRKLLNILEDTGRGMLEIAVICMVAGFVIGAITLTGLGISLSSSLVSLSGGNVLLLLVFAAMACIVLGMGMPITAIYIVVAILIAPALIQLGIEPLAAHLFILYFGAMSFVTPPICIAAYVAASIAHSEPLRTGFTATRLAIAAYLVPFVFALAPVLLLLGSVTDFALIFLSTSIGILMVAIALAGHLFHKLGLLGIIWAAVAGLSLLIPNQLIINGVGLGLAALLFLWQQRKGKAASR
jgi:TRAP transporter 4TM/12TM fusion protein